MKKLRFNVVLALLLTQFVLLANGLLALNAPEYAVIINLAGRQRMLTQKMAKEMLLILHGVNVDANRKTLGETAALFDKTLNGLLQGNAELKLAKTNNVQIMAELNKALKLWTEFKVNVGKMVKGEAVKLGDIADKDLPLLKLLNGIVQMYEKDAEKEAGMVSGAVINLAGRQRMLTQKMTKELLLIALNYEVKTNLHNLQQTSRLFEATLKGLVDGDASMKLPKNTDDAIFVQLTIVKVVWAPYKALIDGVVSRGAVTAKEVATAADLNLKVLTEMVKTVQMFEKIGK